MASPRGCTGSARLNHHHQIAAAAIHAAERIPAQPAAIDLADPSAEAGTADQTRLLQQLPQDINLHGNGLHLTLKAAQVGAEVGDLQVAEERRRSGSARIGAAGTNSLGTTARRAPGSAPEPAPPAAAAHLPEVAVAQGDRLPSMRAPWTPFSVRE